MIFSSASLLLAGAILLDGVCGESLRATASFDSNNVRLGDPMTLSVEFSGAADFAALHPPSLSKEVDGRQWKVDDASARTETDAASRRIVYRVRPLREGLLTFPALSFEFSRVEGGRLVVSTGEMPVHVRPGAQAALSGLEEDAGGLPMPDGICIALAGGADEDELFRWRRACRSPSAAAFAAFDFPEARLNEAACDILEGNWAKAIRIYSALEWRTGQTPAIERGIVAALARKHASAAVELPVWRSAFRPVLRMAWRGRLLSMAAAFAALALLLWACRRIVRALACAAAAFAISASGQAQAQTAVHDPFEEMDRAFERTFENMHSILNSGSRMTINGFSPPQVKVTARAHATKKDVRVGENFEYIIELDAPATATLDQIAVRPSEMFGMVVLGGRIEQLPDADSPNPSNVVHRYSVPVRYDVPFKGWLSFHVGGMSTGSVQSGGRGMMSTISFSTSFSADTPEIPIDIRPLPTDGQPEGFSGIVGTSFRYARSVDRNSVETNDVVTVTHTLYLSGYVPPDAIPGEISRRPGSSVSWRTYFVADGAASIPVSELVVYDADSREYRTLAAKEIGLSYVAGASAESVAVAVDEGADRAGGRVLRLLFSPSASAQAVATVPRDEFDGKASGETYGGWIRIEAGGHAGWVRREELE